MTNKIYEQHAAAFRHVSAYVVLKDGERVATIAFKFPKDGAGRLYAYVHWIGVEMVRGHANGYGYDKRSAAVESAVARIDLTNIEKEARALFPDDDVKANMRAFACLAGPKALKDALTNIGGNNWDRALQDAGFTVLQAV